VRDFGKGLFQGKTPQAFVPGVGISGMRERVKQLNGEFKALQAEPGTIVEAVIPIAEPS
jgi:signal transduction histidine kinase